MCLHCGFSPAAQIFQSDIYTILMKVQTCEKLGRPHCGFFPAAQIFHSDIYTVKRPKFDTLFGEIIFYLLFFLADPPSNFLEVCLKFVPIKL